MATQHVKLGIGAAVIVAAIGYLVLSGATKSTVYFLTVSEVQQRAATLQGRPIRVAGQVSHEPVRWDGRALELAFVLGEGQARLPVQYRGVKPDLFQPGAEVIVEGRLRPDGVLEASTLLTRCPSKYEEEKTRRS
ncbi:MAG: cytochrome C biogenesis protein CcmE [Candidatus Tectimicrobiota bacterium]|nr:MAG: cytochrome C biogenesis protein CcmE [Candidatus Tectomicrobia bacterium]